MESTGITGVELRSSLIKSEAVEESIERKNGYGMDREEELILSNIKEEEEEDGEIQRVEVKREDGEEDEEKERNGYEMEQTDRVLKQGGLPDCKKQKDERLSHEVASCLLKQPSIPSPGSPVISSRKGAPTEKVKSKRRTISQKAALKRRLDAERGKTRVYIGSAFKRWRRLMQLHPELKRDEMIAEFLLDCYEKTTSTPLMPGFSRPPPPQLSTIADSLSEREEDFGVAGLEESPSCSAEETSVLPLHASVTSTDPTLFGITKDKFSNITNSIIDYDEEDNDPSWQLQMETQSVSSFEEEKTLEEDPECDDGDDPDYIPRLCVRKGRALNTEFTLEECPSVNMEGTVHDAGDDTDQEEHEEDLSEPEQEEESPPLPQKKKRSHPDKAEMTVEVEGDISGKPASVAYRHCLKQHHVTVPVDVRKAKDPSTNPQCQA